MSHLTSDNQNVPASGDKPMNSLIPPQEEKLSASDTNSQPLAQKGVEFVRDKAERLPLDLHSDADPDRDRALADSVRGGFVDDVGIDEGRRVVGTRKEV